MSNDKFKFDDFPEGIYIDKNAMKEAQEAAINTIVSETIACIREQTYLMKSIDDEYIREGVPFFIREQASQRLGDILLDLTIAPILTKLNDLYTDEQYEN